LQQREKEGKKAICPSPRAESAAELAREEPVLASGSSFWSGILLLLRIALKALRRWWSMECVTALHGFVATRPFELSFEKGEEVEVIRKGKRVWGPDVSC
jgi:hypothetical protein